MPSSILTVSSNTFIDTHCLEWYRRQCSPSRVTDPSRIVCHSGPYDRSNSLEVRTDRVLD
ncbi:hypothetical protein EA473_03590 [Natrarchaeobius chitinivorans]|uniref:Uncharacterized protein n=1 Tax=Natrarchaeobius chitinivorans TaxID=1679083 RepID=A0A3N6MR87_NATCH|nr:hypothetical protein EA473_03590 [Natrarchaeobius chitinivorans]